MKLRKLSIALLFLITIGLSPAFAGKIGVTFKGDNALQTSIVKALKADGHQIVDISSAKAARLDSVAAASIGKSTGADIIVSGKKLGKVIVLKVLSTKNDTVAGGACPAGDDAVVIDQVKKILADNAARLAE